MDPSSVMDTGKSFWNRIGLGVQFACSMMSVVKPHPAINKCGCANDMVTRNT